MTCEHVTSVLLTYCEIPVSINSIDVIVLCTVYTLEHGYDFTSMCCIHQS